MSIYQHNTGDMLMIFEYELDKLHEFHNLANSLHPRIKIELRFSNEQIEFLHVNVSINNGHVKTDLFSKDTDKHMSPQATPIQSKMQFCMDWRLEPRGFV